MSGLFSAAFLRRIGWTLKSMNAQPLSWSAAAPASPPIRNCSTRSRAAAPAPKTSASRSRRFAIDRHGRITAERHLPQILISWDRLQRLLRATIDPAHCHLGWTLERVEQDSRGVRAHFNGGRVEDADVLVGGDGVRSSVRGQLAPDLQPRYAGYYIWRGFVERI